MILIFLHMIQSAIMIVTGLELFNINYKLKNILIPVMIFGLAIWVVRKVYVYYHIPFGSHTLVLIVLFCIILRLFVIVKNHYVISIALLDFSLIMLGSCLVGYIFNIFHVDSSVVMKSPSLLVVFGQAENIFLIILLVALKNI